MLGDAVGRESSGGVWASVFFQVRFVSLLCSAFLDSGFCLSVCLPARPMYWPGLISWCGPAFSPRTLEGSSVSDRARLMDMLYMQSTVAWKCACLMSDMWMWTLMLMMQSCFIYGGVSGDKGWRSAKSGWHHD